MRVRVFLRQTLFVLPGKDAHLPANAMVITGIIEEQTGFGLRLKVESYFDDRGRKLEGSEQTLLLPGSKIDHILIEA